MVVVSSSVFRFGRVFRVVLVSRVVWWWLVGVMVVVMVLFSMIWFKEFIG